MKKKQKEIKQIHKEAKDIQNINVIFYVEDFLEKVVEFRNDFATNDIFDNREPKPSAALYRKRYELLKKLYALENILKIRIKKLTVVI